jgi:hypothetical protein
MGTGLTFVKVLNDTLFIGIMDKEDNLYFLPLNKEKYTIMIYRHDLGLIENVWPLNDNTMIYTAGNKDYKESGIVLISNKNELVRQELFECTVLEYDVECYEEVEVHYLIGGTTTDWLLYYYLL